MVGVGVGKPIILANRFGKQRSITQMTNPSPFPPTLSFYKLIQSLQRPLEIGIRMRRHSSLVNCL